jgi:hypothetical protein
MGSRGANGYGTTRAPSTKFILDPEGKKTRGRDRASNPNDKARVGRLEMVVLERTSHIQGMKFQRRWRGSAERKIDWLFTRLSPGLLGGRRNWTKPALA